jgi:SAM-dependent methyltransferase
MGHAARAAAYRPSVLHVGNGGASLPDWLGACHEVTLDVNPGLNPDIVASMTDMGDIGPFDSVFCSHALEHLPPHEGLKALHEFLRVLRPGGTAICLVPDLEDIKPTHDVVYESPMGPITGLDMYYGHAGATRDNPWMRHYTGFVKETLQAVFTEAGFTSVTVRRMPGFNLCAIGVK